MNNLGPGQKCSHYGLYGAFISQRAFPNVQDTDGTVQYYIVFTIRGVRISEVYTINICLGHSNLITCLMSFFWKKILSDSKKKKKKVTFGVLRTKVLLKFSVRLQKKKKKF